MNDKNKITREESEAALEPQMQKQNAANSNFELVLLAAQRCRQLVNGADPRIRGLDKKTRNTRIAVKEIKLGLVDFNDCQEE